MIGDVILSMKNVTKRFPGVVALDNVHFEINRGSVHALMGENGAGKSTLMKILMGIYVPDSGEICYKGINVKIINSHQALSMGISMIHQELNNIGEMSVSQNIFLRREPINKYTKLVNFRKMDSDTAKLFVNLGIEGISPKSKIQDLSIAQCQMVEIARAISYNSDIIIMDEPTSAISENEVEKLFHIINRLKDEGRSIIYISHKMDEIFRICDKITVFCDGKFVGTDDTNNFNRQKLIKMMVGRELKELFYKKEVPIGDVIFEVKHLSKPKLFKDISFNVRKGEILGIAGLMGAGRTEVVETIFGMRGSYEGEIIKDGQVLKIKKERDAIKNGIVLATEDRRKLGLVLLLSVKHNISLPSLKGLCRLSCVKSVKEDKKVNELIKRVGIKVSSPNSEASTLSGGNQQKVVLAKWLMTTPDILILDEPTRGIDVGAKVEIYKIMSELVENGKSVIMISSEMPEIIGLSDRILVMHNGRITGELNHNDVTQEQIMDLASN